MWEDVTVVRKLSWGEVKGLEEVHHLAGSVTVIREV